MFHTTKQTYVENFRDWLKFSPNSHTPKRCTRFNGTEFEADYFETPTHKGVTVIALHSTGCDRHTPLVHFYQSFLDAGINVLCLDLDGHGKDSTTIFDSDLLLDPATPHIVEEALNQYDDHIKDQKIVLLGQSLGGASVIDFVFKSHLVSKVIGTVLVGMPVSLNLKKISVFKESFNVISPTLWSSVSTFGLDGVVPALGKFRRKVFPLRVPEGTSYLHHIPRYINGVNLLEKCSRIDIATFNILGKLDSVAQDHPDECFGNTHVTTKHYNYQTHYSLLFSTGYLKDVIAFISTLDEANQ